MKNLPIPEMLAEHIDYLRSEGYEVDVIDGDKEIGVVFKNYPIPAHIYSSDKVDLLVIAHPSYSNPKMDMFWVDPPVTLKKNGQDPKSTGTATKFGKSWQQFSWHVNTWNPAKDNLITYLDTINDRLRRDE